MNAGELFLDAFESIRGNKLRSFLTMLGIVIGVAAVISMLAIGAGAQSSITSQIESAGATVLYVSPGGEATNPQPLTTRDVEALSDPLRAPDVVAVAPILQGSVQVSMPGVNTRTSITGVTLDYFKMQSVELAVGELFSQDNMDKSDAVVVLGSTVVDDLGKSYAELLGAKVRIDGQPFTVIGILASQGGTGFGNADNRILVPFTTAQSRLLRRSGVGEVDQIYVQAASADAVTAATDEITQILRAQHIYNLGQQDFDIFSTQTLLETVQSVSNTFTLFLGGIAGAIRTGRAGEGQNQIAFAAPVEIVRQVAAGACVALPESLGHVIGKVEVAREVALDVARDLGFEARGVYAARFGAADAMVAEAETELAVQPAVRSDHGEFVMEAVGIRKKPRRLECQTPYRIAIADILAERDRVFARRRRGWAEVVDVSIAEGVPNGRVRMERAQPGIVHEHHPGIGGHCRTLANLVEDIPIGREPAHLRLDGAVARKLGTEIDRAVVRKVDLAVPTVRTKELAGVVAARQRDRVEAERAQLVADCREVFGNIPRIGVDRAISHSDCRSVWPRVR